MPQRSWWTWSRPAALMRDAMACMRTATSPADRFTSPVARAPFGE